MLTYYVILQLTAVFPLHALVMMDMFSAAVRDANVSSGLSQRVSC